MAISFCVLGSGSGGNCTLLKLDTDGGHRYMLIDAGLSPRKTMARLAPLGITTDDITDVLLTHVDTDHLHRGWFAADVPPPFTWRAHHRHIHRVVQAGVPVRRTEPFETVVELGDRTLVEATLLPHDHLGSTGFVVDHRGARLGFATDLGRATTSLLDRFTRLDALAIESNYDPALQLAAARPAALKQRIMGGTGHLSNEQCFEAVTQIAAQSKLSQIVLLHLSRQCNDPRLITSHYAAASPELLDRLTITSQFEPTQLLPVHKKGRRGKPVTARNGQQLAMFDA